MNEVGIILLAAGVGQRFGGVLPKQFACINGVNLWQIAYNHLRDAIPNAHIVIVGAVSHQHMWDLSGLTGSFEWVEGGTNRHDSVKAGLTALAPDAPQFVLVHDAARPFVSASVVEALLRALQAGAVAAIPALPSYDTVKRVANAQVVQTLERSELWNVQTPQAFDYAALFTLHQASTTLITDDAALFEQAGVAVQVVQGDAKTFKVTNADDLELAQYYYAKMFHGMFHGNHNVSHETISAMGYDVHELQDLANDTPQYIRLGGVNIPHHQGLSGHSDADVVLHAITDALLGLVGAGDIGQHFPPSNDAFKGKDSAIFLRHAMQILLKQGGELLHVDATIICESPKIAPYRAEMRQRIADILGVELRRVSIKATTTEGLGFTGRREGIATHAIATAKIINNLAF